MTDKFITPRGQEKYRFGFGAGLVLGGRRIECNPTYRCNAQCWACNKAVGLAAFPNCDMTADQMRRAIDQLLDQKVRVLRFTFCGGEPILNRDLQLLIGEVSRLTTLRRCSVRSNGLESTRKRRSKITLPKRFRWGIAGLDNPADPTSGKTNCKKRRRIHEPFWISPADIGMEASFENCGTRGWCGFGLDCHGWSICGKATVLGKLFCVDPTMQEGDIEHHVSTGINEICRHCQYGLPRRRDARRIWRAHKEGKLPDISPSFEKAFARHAVAPVEFAKF